MTLISQKKQIRIKRQRERYQATLDTFIEGARGQYLQQLQVARDGHQVRAEIYKVVEIVDGFHDKEFDHIGDS